MVSTDERTSDVNTLRVLDPDLPFLAAEAALDIDNMLLRGDRDLSAMRQLAVLLSNSFRSENGGGRSRSMMDPATLTVLGEAFADTSGAESLKNVEDLLGEASRIASVLSRENPAENRDELEAAMKFCAALSNAVLTYRRSIMGFNPSHPNRR